MMQQVATTQADIAAFAANTPRSDQQDSSFAKDFGKLLQQHQDAREPSGEAKRASNKSAKQDMKTSPDNAGQQQKSMIDVAGKGEQNSAELEQSAAVKSDNKPVEQTPVSAKYTDGKSSTYKTNVTAVDVSADENSQTIYVHSCAGCAGELVEGDALVASDAKLAEQVLSDINELVRQFELAKLNTQDSDKRSEDLSSSENSAPEKTQAKHNEFQDWSSLVDKLHTLASSGSENAKHVITQNKQLLVEDVANLVQQAVSDKAISPKELVANLLDIKGDLAKANGKSDSTQSPVLVNAVAQILNEIDVSQVNNNSPEVEIQIDALVNKLARLQGAFESSKDAVQNQKLALNQDLGQRSGHETIALANTADGNGLDLSTEKLTDNLNKSLISTVLRPGGDAKEIINVDSQKHSDAVAAQRESLGGLVSDIALAEVQTHIQEVNSTPLSGKESTSHRSLEVLAGMSAENLDKALNNLLQRLTAEQTPSEVQSAQLSQQHVAVVAATQVEQSTLVHSNKDFITALKAGVDEFKAQLAQGREPGIDLKDLVADAMGKSTDTSGSIAKQAQQVEIAVKGFSQVLDFAQQLNGALEQHQANTLSQNNYMAREAGQGQLDQLKQFQAQTSQFDKAVNINKPDGHQQLAEKVRWMVNAKQLVAEIRLDPAELGSMQVKVSVTGESANISFVVQSQQARDAMESATPRLREMLAEKGIELGQSSVKQDQGQGADEGKGQLAGGQHSGAEQGFEDNNEASNENFIQQPIVNGALGGIDYFV